MKIHALPQLALTILIVQFACATSASAATSLRVELLPDRRVTVRWSAAEGEWKLEGSDTLIPLDWGEVLLQPILENGENSVTFVPSATTQFFRLRSATAPSLTSEELIDQAVASGAITDDTASIYRVYALFSDPRLPGAYRGNNTGVIESHALDEAGDKWATLSAEAQAAIQPFFVPPAYRGSWLNPIPAGQAQFRTRAVDRPELDPNWAAVPVSGGNVKVWYDARDPAGHATALSCANALNNDIWPKITGLGILAPLSDLNTARYDGGDSRLDVYIVDMAAAGTVATHLGVTSAVSLARKEKPVFLLVNKTLSTKQMAGTLAHEFMHACQWAYPVSAFSLSSYQWLKESTAQWAIDFVYPTNQLEHAKTKAFLDEPRVSLDVFLGNENHGYGSYLFFQHLSRTVGASLIKDCWAATTTYSEQLQAVDKSIPGGFKDQWPKFAKTAWNQDPIDSKPSSFKKWDDMTDIPATRAGPADLPSGATEDSIALATIQPNLTSTYYHFTFSTAETRSLLFHNTFYTNFKNGEHIRVQAMWRTTAGVWLEEDWTEMEYIGFCRDQKNQRLSDLVVIISSAKWQSPGSPITAAKAPEFKRNNIGCWGYEGTASRVTQDPNGGSGRTTVSATARFGFAPSPQYINPAEGRLRVFLAGPLYKDGALQFDEAYSIDGCSYRANGSFPMPNIFGGGDTAGSIVLNNFAEALPDDLRLEQFTLIGPQERSYTGNGVMSRTITGTVTGADCGDPTYTTEVGLWWLTNGDAFENGAAIPKLRADGHMQGRFVESGDGAVFVWDFAPVQEP
jgi:hypothetical protein